jgi:YidC/Oxa1 family membrane protein insertase
MLWVLNFFYGIIKNYGVAIILLTLLVKVVSYPLTRKGYKSMQAMQKLQPLLTEIREKHRDDPQKLNKVTMQLYKEHGVNPFGGCIPWIPQIPVFIALFALLGSAVELRGAPFFLWIDDLAAPDVLFTLPFTIPFLGDAVRLLPIINGVTTWLQQKTSGSMTPVTDNTQAKIMQFMPLLFVFILYNFASGLALYWLCNNIFTIGQQYLPKLWQSDDTEEATPVSAPSIKKQLQSGKRRSPNANRRK